MIYLPKQVHAIIEEALREHLIKDFAGFMSALNSRRTTAFSNWIKEKSSGADLIDIYYNKKKTAPIPTTISFESAVKCLMDGYIISVIGQATYEEQLRFCYYKGKIYVYTDKDEVWKISTRFFEWHGAKFVDTQQTVDLKYMYLAGVNWS